MKNRFDLQEVNEEVRSLTQDFLHYCDACPHAHDFTCSGKRMQLCNVKKHELRQQIDAKLAQITNERILQNG